MATPYFLAIDVGTSRTAAATARSAPDGALLAASLPLGRNADSTPTTVFVSDSGLLFGDAAERRGTAQPERLVREFKRRIGDDVPIVAGDRRFSPQDLYALVVGWVIGTAVEREGQHPAGIAVSVPVTWGEYRTQLVRDAIGRLGWSDVQVITEPEAAARHYESTHPLESGRALAVYDFGGGTFDTVILQKMPDGNVDFVGSPVGIPDLGGADFDDIVLRHTVRAAGIPASALAGVESDAGLRMALASLRRECVDAKESLSFDGEAVVPVLVGDGHGAVRLTRAEFEDMIEPEIERTVEVLEIALEQSGLTADDLDAILLTGGTSRIPRVAQLLSERFDRPIAVDADPKAIIALGAARTAAGGDLRPFSLLAVDDAPADDDDDDRDDDDADSTSVFTAQRSEKRAPWFRRVPATAYVAAGVAVLTVSVGVVSVPALGVGILARTGMAVTSQPMAADLDVRVFDALDLPSSPPASIAAPQVQPVAEQPAAPQEATSPEEPRSTTRSEERQRTPQRLTPQAAEQRSPSAAPPAQQQASNGGGGGGGGNSAPATQPSSSTPSEPSVPSTPADPTPGGGTDTGTPDPTPGSSETPTTGGSGEPTGGTGGDTGGGDTGTGGDTGGGETGGGETGGGDSDTGGESGGGSQTPEASQSPSASADSPAPSSPAPEPTP